jgi:hypothetical protein
MQLNFGFPDPHKPTTSTRRAAPYPPSTLPWDRIDPNARRTAIQILARAIAQTLGRPLDPQTPERTHDR